MTVPVVAKSNTILVKVHSSNEDIMTCSYGILPINKLFIASIKKLRNILAKENAKLPNLIYKLSSFDNSLDWLTEEESETIVLSEDMSDALYNTGVEKAGFLFIKDKFYAENSAGNLPCVHIDVACVEVKNNGFKFSGHIKHTTTKLDTETIPFSAIGIEPIV